MKADTQMKVGGRWPETDVQRGERDTGLSQALHRAGHPWVGGGTSSDTAAIRSCPTSQEEAPSTLF